LIRPPISDWPVELKNDDETANVALKTVAKDR
jgi:hypothetical protein